VVGVLQRGDDGAALAAVAPVLDRHLHRHLDGGRSVVGVEDARQAGRKDLHQLGGQAGGGLVAEAGEDHLLQRARLLRDGVRDLRMRVAVQVGPPAGDRVEEPAAGRLDQVRPLAAHHWRRLGGDPVLGVRMPHMGGVQRRPLGEMRFGRTGSMRICFR
jgi:hypothetical protein